MSPRYKILPVASCERVKSSYFRFSVRDAELARDSRPGMFCELQAGIPSQERRLFKPVSIYGVEGDEVSFLIKVVGPGTQALASLQAGDDLKLIGPLGNSFPLLENSRVLLVSGGVGYPPLAWLRKLLAPSNHILLIHGGNCVDDVFDCDRAYTIDGSAGSQGFVTKDIPGLIGSEKIEIVYSCGPLPMLKALAGLVSPLPHYVSLEAYMACGVGVCHGCAVPVGNDYSRVCADGPVFRADEIRWEEL